MNNIKHFQKLHSNEQKNVPRVYQYSYKDYTSISSQVVEDLSQSSCSQQPTLIDEDSIFTFNQSNNKKNQLYTTNSRSTRSAENRSNEKRFSFQQNRINQLPQVCIYVSSTNNQLNLTNKKEKSVNSNKKNQYKRCQSLKNLAENLQQQLSNSLSSQQQYEYFSNSLQSNSQSSMRNKQSQLDDSKMNENRVTTRSNALIKSQNIQENNLSRGQKQNNKINNNSFIKPSNKHENNKIESIKYKKQEQYNYLNFSDDDQINQSSSTEAKTQPKQRKGDISISNNDNGSLDYYSTTAKQIKDNKSNNQKNILIFGESIKNNLFGENKNINMNSNSNYKMNKEFQTGFQKTIQKQQESNIFGNFQNPPSTGRRKIASPQTSIAQCKNFQNKNNKQNNSSNEQRRNIFEKISSIKRPFFLYDEDVDDCQDSSIVNSLQTSDETYLNIDDVNIWNNDIRNAFDKEVDRQNQANNDQFNIWNKSDINIEDDLDFNQFFQKKTKSTLQKKQYIGVDSAFTINYEKLRYSSTNSNRLRHFEFNCFKDRDLNIQEKHQNKLQEIIIDDDVQTDDETLDRYVQVCFQDLIVGIDLNKKNGSKEDENSESSKNSLQQSSSDFEHLWDYFQPPQNTCVKS